MVGEKILDERKRRGLSQERLAELLDVSRQTISNWETGMAMPSTVKLKELSSQLDIPLMELLGEEPRSMDAPGEDVPKENEAGAPDESLKKPVGDKSFLAVCVLAVSVFVMAIVACVGIYMSNLQLKQLEPENTEILMEDLEGEEVDIPSTNHIDFFQR